MASSRFHAKKNNEYDEGHKFSREYANLQLFGYIQVKYFYKRTNIKAVLPNNINRK